MRQDYAINSWSCRKLRIHRKYLLVVELLQASARRTFSQALVALVAATCLEHAHVTDLCVHCCLARPCHEATAQHDRSLEEALTAGHAQVGADGGCARRPSGHRHTLR